MRGQRADAQFAGIFRDVRKLRQFSDVDQHCGGGEPELHHWYQAMTAGYNFRLLAVLLQEADCFAERCCNGVVEVLSNHDAFLPLMMFQSFSGRTGVSTCVTPNGESASTTALTTAGVDPIVPASPTPLTPIGLTGDGVTVRSSSRFGRS